MTEDRKSGLLPLIEALSTPDRPTQNDADIAIIRRVWRSFFAWPSRPSGNHSLANVLGAGLLQGDMGDSPARRALHAMFAVLGLAAELPDSRASSVAAGSAKKRIAGFEERWRDGQPSRVNILLVDDCGFRHGWADYVTASLGFERTKNNTLDVYAVGRVGRLAAKLYAIAEPNRFRDLLAEAADRLGSSGSIAYGDEGTPIDVLLLDLRLFGQRDITEEAVFFLELLDMAAALVTTPRSVRRQLLFPMSDN